MIIGVPNSAAWHNRVTLPIGVQPPAIATLSCHVLGFTREDFKQAIEEASSGVMKVRESASSAFYPFPPIFARPLAKLFPRLGWSTHFRVEKIDEYKKQYIEKESQFTEIIFMSEKIAAAQCPL